ncbi:hypothetical protein GCM10012286_46070 [Streptomyces lasiicapitis]|uniref:Uncharacterized protein n=1 Tax=Streptomyces lasiicapitis TaxID=1923961 RepID=A0ABQ2MB66_9ACTN|nr:hypothetical protein GCM10012286_46070 [Streptomyces lasiicapitis]
MPFSELLIAFPRTGCGLCARSILGPGRGGQGRTAGRSPEDGARGRLGEARRPHPGDAHQRQERLYATHVVINTMMEM